MGDAFNFKGLNKDLSAENFPSFFDDYQTNVGGPSFFVGYEENFDRKSILIFLFDKSTFLFDEWGERSRFLLEFIPTDFLMRLGCPNLGKESD